MSERRRLLPSFSQPQYVFDANLGRERRFTAWRITQFHFCFLFLLSMAVILVLISLLGYVLSTKSASENSTDVPADLFVNLVHRDWPVVEEVTNDTAWAEALAQGKQALNRKNAASAVQPPTNSPSYKHQKIVSTSKKARELADLGYVEENARRYFPRIGTKICHSTNGTSATLCQKTRCNIFQKFRSYNGSCNNLKHPQFGEAYRPFKRLLPADYADGISAPRRSQNKQELPSARTISLEVHRPYYKNDNKFSVVLATWGQFLDHDMTATALSQGVNGTLISCCANNTHPECFPVIMDSFDPFQRYNVTCMEFVRSAPAPTCCLGPREQMNQVSSFIDGSVIYGVDEDVVKSLRTGENGGLKMYITQDGRSLLPVSLDLNDGCNRQEEKEKGRYCFMTGDGRANENLHLTSMHLIWARQHNHVTEKLLVENPHWNDERLFEESRKILGAQLQHITYNEFLPILLGPMLMERFDLRPRTSGYFANYDDGIDPSIANNFATAAFRFAHSIIPGLMKFLANDSSSPEFVELHKMLLDPFKLYEPGELDRALRGALDTAIEASDPYFTDELKQHLFEDDSDKKRNLCGLDLVSLNIQRGRDHGLVGYNSWREHCGLTKVSSFDQLQGSIDRDSLQNIKSVYRDVDDIDLYTGSISEKPLNGSILGATLTCLILDQFVRVKLGDRFWYEAPNWFTLAQLTEIRRTTLAGIICTNSDNVTEVQGKVMERRGAGNEAVPCGSIPELDFSAWKEAQVKIGFVSPGVSISARGN